DVVQVTLTSSGGHARYDVSMLETTTVDQATLGPQAVTYSDSGASSPLDWSATFEFRASTLRRFNPLPYLLQLLLEVHGLRSQSGELYSVLSELYSNALEHGVLGLDSKLKRDAAGFARYYRERGERLVELEEGFIRVHLRVVPAERGGRLT